MDWLISASIVLAGLGLAGAGVGAVLYRVSTRPPNDLEVALQQLRAERARDKAELAEIAERMVDAGERIHRARARIETANQRAEERENKQGELEGIAGELAPLEQIKLRARRLGKL